MTTRREADRTRWVPYKLVTETGAGVYPAANYAALNVAVITTHTLLKLMGKL